MLVASSNLHLVEQERPTACTGCKLTPSWQHSRWHKFRLNVHIDGVPGVVADTIPIHFTIGEATPLLREPLQEDATGQGVQLGHELQQRLWVKQGWVDYDFNPDLPSINLDVVLLFSRDFDDERGVGVGTSIFCGRR